MTSDNTKTAITGFTIALFGFLIAIALHFIMSRPEWLATEKTKKLAKDDRQLNFGVLIGLSFGLSAAVFVIIYFKLYKYLGF